MTRNLDPRRMLSHFRVNRQCLAWLVVSLVGFLTISSRPSIAEEPSAGSVFRDAVEPILADYCYGCHGGGIKKGSVTLDDFPTDASILDRKDLWLAVLKNVRAGLMPPAGKPQPSAEELATLETWIKRKAFDLDPTNPDPGRVTLRRLNRVEYRNTIRDLMGIDFRADEEFPADDTGYGFDNIGDALSISPLLLEKYMQAAETIAANAVPIVDRVVQSRSWSGNEFRGESGRRNDGLSLYQAAKVARTIPLAKSGSYRVSFDLGIRGAFNFDPGRAVITVRLGDRELLKEEMGWGDGRKAGHEFELPLDAGDHSLSFEIEPKTAPEKQLEGVSLRINSVRVDGPLAESEWVRPTNFDRFFDRDVPTDPDARRTYAREILGRFTARAYRRPVDLRLIDRLTEIALGVANQPGKNFAQGISQAIVAVLASPRFLFRIEAVEPTNGPRGFTPVDEYSLASRLSYFLWSTMPDEELIRLAEHGELRAHLGDQVKRMLADSRSEEFVRNFTGQWLQARDFEHFPIQTKSILRQERLPAMSDAEVGDLKRSMRQETEAFFSHMVHDNRPILDLIDSDYAFLNGTLAKHYGVPGVTGREIRRVKLPEGSPRGGLLTQAGVLMITSNPGRTSAVKRGQFILENILGTPAPPPPPDIPSLEDALRGIGDREPTMREVMEVHRAAPLCAACHNRMDPLGLAFENFNALGLWRETERRQPIDASGKLVTGRTFQNARDLKVILRDEYRVDIYRCLTEKLMTYALGRGLEYADVESIDQVVSRIESAEGRFSALLTGIIESAPFQKRREVAAMTSNPPESSAKP